jgi:branched-subunit amino acid aminotransferase/4-amino-4-deoxychorismate lyase
MSKDRIQINGSAPGAEDLAFLAQVNYGHFTTLQVRNRCARGFELHLDRLAHATRELFGTELNTAQVRHWVAQLVDDEPASLRITVFSRGFNRVFPERTTTPDVLIALSPAREPTNIPLRVRAVQYERAMPMLKHIGTFDLFHHLRRARLTGFDDVMFVTHASEIAEGSTWNVGFWDGQRVHWPAAPALNGVTRRLLDRGLNAQGVETITGRIRIEELSRFRAAFACHSANAGRPIASIDQHVFETAELLETLLRSSYELALWEPI